LLVEGFLIVISFSFWGSFIIEIDFYLLTERKNVRDKIIFYYLPFKFI
jgi:hypothetical protein